MRSTEEETKVSLFTEPCKCLKGSVDKLFELKVYQDCQKINIWPLLLYVSNKWLEVCYSWSNRIWEYTRIFVESLRKMMRLFLEVSKLSIAEEMSRAFRVKDPALRMFFPVNSQKGVLFLEGFLGHLSFPSILFDAEPLCSFPFHMPDPTHFQGFSGLHFLFPCRDAGL